MPVLQGIVGFRHGRAKIYSFENVKEIMRGVCQALAICHILAKILRRRLIGQ